MATRFDATPTTAKREAVQAQLLTAAHAVLEEGSGYVDLSIERITSRAGLSRTAFYFYFADKSELLLALAEDVAAQFFAGVASWFAGEGPTDEDTRQGLTNILELYDQHGAVVAILVEAATSDERASWLWHSLIGRFVDATQARIERDQAAGQALPGPARELAFSLCWMTERVMYERHLKHPGEGGAELVDALTAIWTRSIYGT
jgi:TetR/AcrR family transcriptional regulator, ethionamide resistance regulator